MARDYGRIRSQFWPDEKVRTWSLELKAVAAYLLTCEHATALGAYRLPAAYMSDDLGITPQQARDFLSQLQSQGWLKVCRNTGWIWISNYLRHNRPENPNVWRHVRGLAAAMPDGVAFRAEIMAALESDANQSKTVPEPQTEEQNQSRNPIETVSNNRTEPNLTEPIPTEPIREREAARGCRIPGDWEPGPEGEKYARQNGFDPAAIARMSQRFRDHWLAKSGREAVKLDWPATWRTWVSREIEYQRSAPRRDVIAAGSNSQSQRDRQKAAALASLNTH